METVFNVLFISKDLPEIFRRAGPVRVAGFRREIKDFLRLVVGLLRYVQQNPRDPGKIDHHLALARALGTGDAVLSLNYDTLMDNALLRLGWDPATGYGFDASGKISYAGAARAVRGGRAVLLLKPHGSLNWFARGSAETLETVLAQQSPSRVILSPVPRAYDLAAAEMIRFFIPPLYTKFFANPFWQGLWRTAFDKLVEADELIVIGCSMVESDFHLRSIFARALARRSRRFDRIVLVERNLEVTAKLKLFLRAQSRRGFETHPSFTDYVANRL